MGDGSPEGRDGSSGEGGSSLVTHSGRMLTPAAMHPALRPYVLPPCVSPEILFPLSVILARDLMSCRHAS